MTTPTKKIVAHGAFGPGQGESSYEYLRLNEDYRALQGACKGLADQVEALTKERDGLAPPDIKALQAEGKGPSPCARFCEAKAFEIAISNAERERDALAAAGKLALEALVLAYQLDFKTLPSSISFSDVYNKQLGAKTALKKAGVQ